jgi:hypothetical protein
VNDLFVVKDLERLKEYGFQTAGYTNSKGRVIYRKEIGESQDDYASASLALIVNAEDKRENEIVVCCEAELATDVKSVCPVMWAFDELSEMLHDDVIAWSKLPRP